MALYRWSARKQHGERQCTVKWDRNLKPKLAIMRQCTSVTDRRQTDGHWHRSISVRCIYYMYISRYDTINNQIQRQRRISSAWTDCAHLHSVITSLTCSLTGRWLVSALLITAIHSDWCDVTNDCDSEYPSASQHTTYMYVPSNRILYVSK